MTIVEYILLFIFIISYSIGIVFCIRDIFLLLIPAIKCHKIKGCTKDNCPFRSGCRHISYSSKEKARIRQMIAKLK